MPPSEFHRFRCCFRPIVISGPNFAMMSPTFGHDLYRRDTTEILSNACALLLSVFLMAFINCHFGSFVEQSHLVGLPKLHGLSLYIDHPEPLILSSTDCYSNSPPRSVAITILCISELP